VVTVNQGHSSGYGAAETMIAREAVAFVDNNRSTVDAAGGRVLAGHSLGGMGALYVGTRHPDIFGSIGAISSACFLVDPCDTITAAILGRLGDRASGLERTGFVVSWGSAEDGRSVGFQEQVSLALSSERHGPIHRFVLDGVDHDFGEQLAAPATSGSFARELAASLASALSGT
jgi:pimeloyl-ACP methyl ester carboxylesterase